MNKQQLASKIWEAANKTRSKIEANEYKDYEGISLIQIETSLQFILDLDFELVS